MSYEYGKANGSIVNQEQIDYQVHKLHGLWNLKEGRDDVYEIAGGL